MASRRSVLIGLGGLVAGGGAILGTGAFDTVEAQRTVSVETAGDADALLALTAVDDDSPYVEETDDDTIEITLDGNDTDDAEASGLNQNAVTTFDELVSITNNGTETVDSITFTIDVSEADDNGAHEDAFSIVANDETAPADGNDNILSDDYYDRDLESGEDVNFGIEIDLLNEGITDIEDDAEFALTISAEALED